MTDDALLYSFQSATNPFDQTNKTSEVMLLYGCNRPALLTVSGAWRHLLYQLMKYHMTFSVQRATASALTLLVQHQIELFGVVWCEV